MTDGHVAWVIVEKRVFKFELGCVFLGAWDSDKGFNDDHEGCAHDIRYADQVKYSLLICNLGEVGAEPMLKYHGEDSCGRCEDVNVRDASWVVGRYGGAGQTSGPAFCMTGQTDEVNRAAPQEVVIP